MIKNQIYLIVVLFSIFTSPAIAQDECKELSDFAAIKNRNLPKYVDEITRLVQIRVNCENKNITYVNAIDVNFSLLAQGFRERKQQQHTELHCNRDGLARVGWTVRNTIMDPNIETVILTTRPEHCR